MEKQSKYEAFITEVNSLNQKPASEFFSAMVCVHLTMWAYTKEECADKVAEIISAAIGKKLSKPHPYLSSVLEWSTGVENELDIKFGIEKMK